MKFTVEQMRERLPLPANEKWKDGVWDIEPFEKSGVKLVFFAPEGTDYQTSHEEDEFYFIVGGTGELVIAGERFAVQPGDVFFVEGGVEHHFENFDHLVTWAIFF